MNSSAGDWDVIVDAPGFALGVRLADDMVAGIEVYKTRTPDQVEGSQTGVINLTLRRPTDFKEGATYAFSVRGDYADQVKKVNPYVSALVAYNADTAIGQMGFSVNGSINDVRYNESIRWDGMPHIPGSSRLTFEPSTTPRNIYLPHAIGFSGPNGRSKRADINVSTQWRPDDRWSITLEGGYRKQRMLWADNQFDIPLTIFAVAMAAQRHPDAIKAMAAAGHEICSHGYRWIDYQYMSEAEEREHMLEAIRILEGITGERPLGWYTGRTGPNTRRIVMEEGGFLYDSDTYDDDLPYWDPASTAAKPHLVIPYTLDTNDMRFTQVQGFNTGDDFYQYLKDAFDVLYAEGVAGAPKMLSIGMHCRLLGRPARIAALARFIEYVKGHDKVWCARRVDIARHWHATHPFSENSK